MLNESFSVFLFQQSLEFHLRAGGELFRIRQKLVEQFRRPRFVAATAHIGEREVDLTDSNKPVRGRPVFRGDK